MHAQANSHFHDRRRALLPCRSFEPPCPTLEALFEEASILAGSDVFIHGLVAALGTGTKRNTQSCLAQTDRALAGKSRRQEKYHRYRRWVLARCSSRRLRFRNFFANLPWRLCTLAHQSWRSQIRGQLRKRVRHVPTI